MKKNKSEFYIDKAELNKEIKIYKKSGEITEKLGIMLMKIANRYASKPCFSGYTFKDEFIAEAVARMIDQLHKIDLNHKKCNPFSYLTQMCYWKFVSKINEEKQHALTKSNFIEHYITEFECSEHVLLRKNQELSHEDYETN